MANTTETITLEILAKDLASGPIGGFIGKLDAMAQKGGIVGSLIQGIGQSFGQMLNPVGLATEAISLGTEALTGFLEAGIKGQAVQAKLNTALQDNVPAWQSQTGAIEDATSAGVRLGFANDDLESSMASLVVHTHDVSKAVVVQAAAMDLARFKNISLEDATNVLGKAYDGNTAALKRMGIELDKGVSGLQAIGEVEGSVAGQADAFSQTLQGQADTLAAETDRFQTKVGEGLLPVVTQAFGALNNMLFGTVQSTQDATTKIGLSYNVMRQQTSFTVDHIEAAWRDASVNIPNAIETASSTTHRLFQSWLQQDKQDLKALADDLAHDPRDKKRLLKWLPDAMKTAQDDLIRAERTGDANAIAEAGALVTKLDAEWQQLHAHISIGVGVTTGGAGGHRLLQHGGPVRAGEPVIVGETRPELFVPSVSGTVYPSVGAGVTNNITVNWHSLAVPTEAEGQRMAQVIAPHLERELRRRRTFA